MPYIIETHLPSDLILPASHPRITRRAVATLLEARERILCEDHFGPDPDTWAEHDANCARVDECMEAVEDLPESGGTIGPLPDGTTIRVKRVSANDLDSIALELDLSKWATADEWCDAYNSAQAAR